MSFTERVVAAQKVLSMRLTSRVVTKGKVVEEAMKIVKMLVRFPRLHEHGP